MGLFCGVRLSLRPLTVLILHLISVETTNRLNNTLLVLIARVRRWCQFARSLISNFLFPEFKTRYEIISQ